MPATFVRRVKEVCCEVMAELSGVREGYSEVSQLGCEKLLSEVWRLLGFREGKKTVTASESAIFCKISFCFTIIKFLSIANFVYCLVEQTR